MSFRRLLKASVAVVVLGAVSPAMAEVFFVSYGSGAGVTRVDTSTGTRATFGADQIYYGGKMAVGPDGNVYVGGAFTQEVFRVSPATGAVTNLAYVWPVTPESIAFDASGSMLIATQETITGAANFEYTPLTKFDSNFNTVQGYSLDYPFAMAATPDGSVYVSQSASVRRITKISPSGAMSTFASNVFIGDLTTGPDGSLYASLGRSIVKFNDQGVSSVYFTNPTLYPQSFGSSVFGSDGTLYFVYGANSIVGVRPDGTSFVAASGLTGGISDLVIVPEPASASAAAGIALIGLLRRRR